MVSVAYIITDNDEYDVDVAMFNNVGAAKVFDRWMQNEMHKLGKDYSSKIIYGDE